MAKNEKLALVTFDNDGKPWCVVAYEGRGSSTYDFVWAEKEQTLYYYNSGGGPLLNDDGRLWNPGDHQIWVAPELRDKFDQQEGQTLLEELPEGYRSFAEMTEDASEGKTVWCDVCQSYLGEDDNVPCNHLIWSDEYCGHIGTGNPDAEGVDYKTPLLTIFQKTGIARPLNRSIKQSHYDIHLWGSMLGPLSLFCWLDGSNYGDAFSELPEDEVEAIQVGVTWLLTLEPGKTVEAEKRTLEIIKEYFLHEAARIGEKAPLPKGSCACGADHSTPDSVTREYFSKDEEASVFCKGYYGKDDFFEPTETVTLAGGRYDLADDSDICSYCGGLV